MALAYFLSALLRAVTGTLAPTLTREFGLSAGELGLLAGGYFLGFSAMQLPLGRWLDQHGPRRVQMVLLVAAVASGIGFATAMGFGALLLARILGGVGVCACLMAPLTGYRHWFAPEFQQRANSWMLMTGSLGMLASTLPVQWLLPVIGWRGVFWAMAGLFAVAIGAIAWQTPRWPGGSTSVRSPGSAVATGPAGPAPGLWASYRPIFGHPFFRRAAPLALLNFAALLAVQTLWAGPWLTTVVGLDAAGAAQGLFAINFAMLSTYWLWGLFTPRLERAGWGAERLLRAFGATGAIVLGIIAVLGPQAHWPWLALFCMGSSVLSLAQPAVGMAFPLAEAGRALSAYNLLMFVGTFVLQWAIGLGLDALQSAGLVRAEAFRIVFGALSLVCVAAYLRFLRGGATR